MPTLTAIAADTAPPRVDILFSGAEMTGASTVTIYQISSLGRVVVRDGTRVPSVGGAFKTDYEAPLGEVVTYQGEKFDGAGVSLGLTDPTTVTVDWPSGVAVFQDPLAPGSWVAVTAETQFANSIQRSRDVTMYRRGTQTIALMGELGLIESVSLRVFTQTSQEAAALRKVLNEGYFLIRTAAMSIPAAFHGALPNVVEIPDDAKVGGTFSTWDVTASEVSRSDLGVIVSLVTYARFKAVYATYAAAKLVYSTYLQAKQSPPPEV